MWCCLIFERSFDKIQSLGFIILIKFQRLNAALHRINGIYIFHGKKRTGTATSAGYDRMSIFTGFHLFNQIKANQSRFFCALPHLQLKHSNKSKRSFSGVAIYLTLRAEFSISVNISFWYICMINHNDSELKLTFESE